MTNILKVYFQGLNDLQVEKKATKIFFVHKL